MTIQSLCLETNLKCGLELRQPTREESKLHCLEIVVCLTEACGLPPGLVFNVAKHSRRRCQELLI